MADIKALADATVKLKPALDKSVGWARAAAMAVERSGIRHKPDVARISKEVLSELGTRGATKKRKLAQA